MRAAPILFLAFLAGCSGWPDTGAPPLSRRGGDWPKLEPLSEILAERGIPEASVRDAATLEARAGALRQRAALMRQAIADQDAFEALRARLAR